MELACPVYSSNPASQCDGQFGCTDWAIGGVPLRRIDKVPTRLAPFFCGEMCGSYNLKLWRAPRQPPPATLNYRVRMEVLPRSCQPSATKIDDERSPCRLTQAFRPVDRLLKLHDQGRHSRHTLPTTRCRSPSIASIARRSRRTRHRRLNRPPSLSDRPKDDFSSARSC
jgi:hypothetical protein